MINPLGDNFLGVRKMSALSEVTNLDQRLGLPKADTKNDADVEQLYANLKLLWERNPEIRSEEIVDYIQKYTVNDGSAPFKERSTHIRVFAQLMEMLKTEGGENSPIYEMLNKGMASAVAFNGILNSFKIAMVKRPEEPESWA